MAEEAGADYVLASLVYHKPMLFFIIIAQGSEIVQVRKVPDVNSHIVLQTVASWRDMNQIMYKFLVIKQMLLETNQITRCLWVLFCINIYAYNPGMTHQIFLAPVFEYPAWSNEVELLELKLLLFLYVFYRPKLLSDCSIILSHHDLAIDIA